jgi:hypothetical protein
MARITCKTKKARNSLIRRKIKEAAAELAKDRPKDAGIELHIAAFAIRRNAQGIWSPKAIRDIGNDASWVGDQLMKPSTMHWPKWKDRMDAIVKNVEREVQKTNARCR